MKLELVLVLFVSLSCLNQESEENDDIIIFHLDKEMDRMTYSIKQNQTAKFIKFNDTYNYLIELPKRIIAHNAKNNTFRDLVSLSILNQSITIEPQDDSGKDIEIHVTSILNNVDVYFLKKFHSKIFYSSDRNIIIIVYVDEKEDQIISLSSFENSLLFYIYKYDYNNISPKDINPINKTLFNRYEEDILYLNKNSVYILYAELYKLDYNFNMLPLFISPKQLNKSIIIKKDDEMLYLKESEDYYNITFEESEFSRIFKLSKKTNDSEVITSKGETILNGSELYYELTQDNISNGVLIKVKNSDCLIEILLSSKDKMEVLDSYSIENYKLTKQYTIIKIPKNKCIYDFSLSSNNKKNLKLFYFGIKNTLSKNNYFYNWVNCSKPYDGKELNFNYISPYLYRTEVDDDEFQIFEIALDMVQLENDIFLTYHPVSYFKYLYKPIDEDKSHYIIGNISSYLNNFYIYKDIAKKPPKIENLENYHHKPIDLVDSLSKISTKNKTYLSLFQEINKVLKTVRDDHLNILLNNIEDKLKLPTTSFCIPFEFYIDTEKGVERDIPVVKIRPFYNCLFNYRNKKFINDNLQQHVNISLKSINNTEPFEYIQNFGKYQKLKNRHAQFTDNLNSIKSSRIDFIPFDLSDLVGINYEFENGDIINLDYYFVTPSNFKDINQEEFEEFHLSINNNQPSLYLIPNIFQSKKLFQKKKGILFEEDKTAIEWDIETKDKLLKCKVDKEFKYNVFLQSGFMFSSFNDAIDVMVKCSELFYSNDYKIIGIENNNGGGTAPLYEIWHQFIQQKTLDKTYRAVISNKEFTKYFKEYYLFSGFSNIDTCKFFDSMKEMNEVTDDYGFSEEFKERIEHKRTKIYDFLDRTWRKRLEKIRKNNFAKNKLKNPTDILIYTDSYCFSACSGFIKAFQNTGGAIIVGFNGNPKIKGINEFDGSQSPSSVTQFSTKEKYELENLGYHIYGATFAESFDDSCKESNPNPREYSVDLVDRRVDIYGPYSDSLYSSFILKAENIFEEFENKCNKNNKRLLLNDDNCQFKDHKKGGHPCRDDETWDKESCKAYYCDFGYYYDQYKEECILDICTNIENEIDIYLDGANYNDTKEFIVEPNNELVFHLQNDNYYYFFESNVDKIFIKYNDNQNKRNSLTLCMVEYTKESAFDYEVSANYFRTLQQNATIKLTTIEKKQDISIMDNIEGENLYIFSYITKVNQNKLIYSFQTSKEHIIYAVSFNKGMNAYFSEYNFDIEPQEIINIESKKFNEVSNKISIMQENKTSILIYKYPNNIISSIYLLLTPKDVFKDIDFENERFIYLSQQYFEYNLYFTSNSKNFYIRLDSQTPDAEIEILDKNNTILNKDSNYYFVSKKTKKISLRLKNNNSALIEFLYEFNNFTSLDIKKKRISLR